MPTGKAVGSPDPSPTSNSPLPSRSLFIIAPAAFTLVASVTSALASIASSLALSAADIEPAAVVAAVVAAALIRASARVSILEFSVVVSQSKLAIRLLIAAVDAISVSLVDQEVSVDLTKSSSTNSFISFTENKA